MGIQLVKLVCSILSYQVSYYSKATQELTSILLRKEANSNKIFNYKP